MDHLHNTLNITFDGLWLDMNENSNFCFGTCYDNQKPETNIKNNLPYIPGDRNLEFKTLSMEV
jgi:alpha-glucosidase (family GH31 glycosyl hydrolase)